MESDEQIARYGGAPKGLAPSFRYWRFRATGPIGLAALALFGGSLDVRADELAIECSAFTSSPPKSDNPDNSALDGETGLSFGRIDIRAGDLFDRAREGEGRWVHGVANALHMSTRAATIAAAIPFASGEPFTFERLQTAERLLRRRRFLREVVIVPVRRCGDAVDIEVRTIDNWTLTPSISFTSAGGTERYTVELQDLNVLGTGKELKFRLSRSGDERERTFIYGDDNVFGGPYRLRLELGDTEDGERHAVTAGLPFLLPDSPTSWWLSAGTETRSFAVERSGTFTEDEIGVNVPVDSSHVDLGFALGRLQSSGGTLRGGAGVRFERQLTNEPTSITDDVGATDFEEAYPYIFVARARPAWSKRRHFLGIGRVEDIDAGFGVRLEVGALLEAFSNDRNGLRLATELTQGWRPDKDSLHRLTLTASRHLVGSSGSAATRDATTFRYQYFRWLNQRNQLDLRVVAQHRPGRSPADNLRLGGEFGLKGYPNGYQEGEERVVSLLEYRHVTHWKPFALADVALSAFAEAGRGGGHGSETLADVGFGMMLSPTRGSRHDVIRFDIAVPLVDGPGVADFLLFVGSRLTY